MGYAERGWRGRFSKMQAGLQISDHSGNLNKEKIFSDCKFNYKLN